MKSKSSFIARWIGKAYLWATELLYHRLAWAYDFIAGLVSFGLWSQWRIDALTYLCPGRVLEIGFGTGELLIELTERNRDVTGLELSPEMQRITRRKLQRKGIGAKRVMGRAEAIPFSSAYFSNVIATFPSNYILHEETLKEIHRVLFKEGRLIMAGLTVRFKSGIRRWLTGWFLEGGYDEVLAYVEEKAKSTGFHVHVTVVEGDDYVLPVLILEPDDD